MHPTCRLEVLWSLFWVAHMLHPHSCLIIHQCQAILWPGRPSVEHDWLVTGCHFWHFPINIGNV